MPIDPNIALKVEPFKLNDPMETYTKMLSLKNLIQTNKQNEQLFPLKLQEAQDTAAAQNLKMTAMQQQQAEQKIVQEEYVKAGGDLDELFKVLPAKVSPTTLATTQKAFADSQEALMKMQSQKRALMVSGSQRLGEIANSMTDDDSYSQGILQAYNEGLIDVNAAKKDLQRGFDPKFVDGIKAKARTVEQMDAKNRADVKEAREAPQAEATLAKTKAETQELLSKSHQGGLTGKDAILANTWMQQNAKGKTFAQLNPEETSQMMQYIKSASASPEDEALKQATLATKQQTLAMNQSAMQNITTPEDYQNIAQMVVDKRLAPSQFNELRTTGMMGGKMFVPSQVLKDVLKIDPKFSWMRADAEYKAMASTETKFASGTESNLVRSNNVALEHLGLLDEARKALANGNVTALNTVANALGQATGKSAKTVFDEIGRYVSQEVSKAYISSGGGETERLANASNFSSSYSDTQLKDNIGATVGLLASQQRGMAAQYQRGTYGKGALFTDENDILTDRAREVKQKLLGGKNAAAAKPKAKKGDQVFLKSGQMVELTTDPDAQGHFQYKVVGQ